MSETAQGHADLVRLPATYEYVERIIKIFRNRPDDDTTALVLTDYAKKALAALRAENMKLQAENRGLFLAHRIQHDLRDTAEAEVARLKAENKELVAGLEPFSEALADLGDPDDILRPDSELIWNGTSITFGELRRARSLTATKGE